MAWELEERQPCEQIGCHRFEGVVGPQPYNSVLHDVFFGNLYISEFGVSCLAQKVSIISKIACFSRAMFFQALLADSPCRTCRVNL